MATTLPDKLFYKIGEVAEVAGVRTSVLRFWETEFTFLKPTKSSAGQRLYSKAEVELILQVKNLLYNEKFTIEGVKKRISSKGKLLKPEEYSERESTRDYGEVLKAVRADLISLRGML